MNKNDLLQLLAVAKENYQEKFMAYANASKLSNPERLLSELELIQICGYNYLWEVTQPTRQLTQQEICQRSEEFYLETYQWMNENGLKALQDWLVWKCNKDGILKT
ncbi:hypothetical protein [Echinicola sp. 20G]|uniref:hypothetical protein n=1 Tax=Echinicola sp. 20G TaxID=2781961 RepID=UPI001910EFCE|nr:hypothetical protein [Echinicola sp. 20G]